MARGSPRDTSHCNSFQYFRIRKQGIQYSLRGFFVQLSVRYSTSRVSLHTRKESLDAAFNANNTEGMPCTTPYCILKYADACFGRFVCPVLFTWNKRLRSSLSFLPPSLFFLLHISLSLGFLPSHSFHSTTPVISNQTPKDKTKCVSLPHSLPSSLSASQLLILVALSVLPRSEQAYSASLQNVNILTLFCSA